MKSYFPLAVTEIPATGSGSASDIIETGVAAQNLKTLIRTSEAVGLYDKLRGEGPFTVFAPSDAAFEKLPGGTLEAFLADQNRLVAVPNYHMVPERLTAADLLQRRESKTVHGNTLSIDQLEVKIAISKHRMASSILFTTYWCRYPDSDPASSVQKGPETKRNYFRMSPTPLHKQPVNQNLTLNKGY